MIRRIIAIVAVLAVGIYAYAGNMQAAEAQGMDIAIGSTGYEFSLMDLDDNSHTLSSYLADGKTVVLEWYNPGCPFVKKYYDGSNPSMLDAKAFAAENDVVWLAVNSGAPGKQGAGLELNQQYVEDWGIDNPILLDESGEVGRMFGAANTPQLIIMSAEGAVLYNGGVDEAKMSDDVPEHNFVINALTQHMAGEEVDPAVTPHIGCSVKYGPKPVADDATEPSTAQGGAH